MTSFITTKVYGNSSITFLAGGASKLTFSFAGGAATELASKASWRLRDGFKIPFDGVGIPVRFVGNLLAGCGSFELVSPKTFLSILKISFKKMIYQKIVQKLEFS